MERLFDTLFSGYDQPVLDVEAVRFNISVISYKGCEGPDSRIEKTWHDLKFTQIRGRWWYFRRVAAKMQLENPFRVYCFQMHRTLNEQDATKAKIKRLIDKQRSAKAKITEITNKIEHARANWNRLFPIEEDDNYKAAMSKVFQKRQDVADLQKEIDELTASTQNQPK
ncbi:MAG: hypothetical protein LCH81_03590 [Bacteroidetes bacterium]|nr:hypothetical protein [Bacteroidota bacterium]